MNFSNGLILQTIFKIIFSLIINPVIKILTFPTVNNLIIIENLNGKDDDEI